MSITPHFTLTELTRSEAAERLALSNQPGAEHLSNLRLAALGMEMVRLIVGRPIRVTSGYRAPAVNRAVGGTPTSAHALGYAVDFIVPTLGLAETARMLVGRLPYDQLIYEHNRCVHISFDTRLRGQALTQRGGPGSPIEPGILD